MKVFHVKKNGVFVGEGMQWTGDDHCVVKWKLPNGTTYIMMYNDQCDIELINADKNDHLSFVETEELDVEAIHAEDSRRSYELYHRKIKTIN